MRIWSSPILKSLLVPGGVLLAGVAGLVYPGWLTLTIPAVSFLYYCAVAGGLILAWRFHSSRTFLALAVLFLAVQSIGLFGGGQLSVLIQAVRAFAVLVPLDFVLIALMRERGFTAESLNPAGLVLFVEFIVVAGLCRGTERSSSPSAKLIHVAANAALPDYAILIFVAAALFLLGKFLLTHKPVDSALLWTLGAFYLSLHHTGNERLSTLFAATGATILATSIIENSYLLAYHDELTGLPSRRAFNDGMLRLQVPFSIAVVDIDHFKRFNDTYGHDTGDEVLRLVASKLAGVTGGGLAYRCGGEEFIILFPGKTTPEVVGHLQTLRLRIEAAEFRTRGSDRRRVPRGPERRNLRRSSRKGDAIRELAREKADREESDTSLSVTVSVGVATSPKAEGNPQTVLEAADKALYRAKANGRNRLETATPARRGRVKAAGIA